jgi:hypothetical protein
MIKFKVSSDSIADITSAITATKRTQTRLKNRQVPLREMKKYHKKRWLENVEGSGSFYGGFAPLRPMTVAKRGASGPILQESGKLMSYINTASEQGIVTADAVNWNFQFSGGKDGSYAVLHTTGYYNAMTGTMVTPRVVFDTNEIDQQNDEDTMQHWIDRIVAQYF